MSSELEQRLAAQALEIDALRTELEETNQGVLALYAELDTQAQQLRQATELKSRFLAYMSHEFRTPLASIRSLARLLLDRVDGPLTAEQEKQVKFIQSTAMEFSEMVDDLLDLAKVEAGPIDISPAWFEMVDLFSALRGMFKPVLTNPEVTLIFEEPPASLKLYTDDKKLSQILRNFISNALKFTPGGEVRVSAAQAGEELVTFSVADTRTSPWEVNFKAFEMKLRRICESLRSSVKSLGSPSGSSKISAVSGLVRTVLNMPRNAEKRSTISNQAGEMSTRPASILARSSRSSTISENSVAVVWMKPTCRSCSCVSGPSTRSTSRRAMLRMALMGVRNSWLM